MNNYHTSVLLREAIDFLDVKPGKKYIDATLGGGGHTGEILKRGGMVLGLDVDQDALNHAKENLKLRLAKGNFKDIDKLAKENGFEQVDGILFDLGVSSHHFDDAKRGFSLQKEGPIDMRMDLELGVKAGDLINILTKGELNDLFRTLGEERFSQAIAHGIVSARKVGPIQTTTELAEIIKRAVPGGFRAKIHPATKVFQALRIAINDELNSIKEGLPKARALLGKRGKLVVISFHSLEDRIVKHMMKDWEEAQYGKILTKKPIVPSDKEQEENARSRSAKMRVFQNI